MNNIIKYQYFNYSAVWEVKDASNYSIVINMYYL
jgi:hypothetical protein